MILICLSDYGGSSGGFRDERRGGGFEEYNAGDDDTSTRRSTSISRRAGASATSPVSPRRANSAAAAPPPKPKEPEIDLLGGFGDEDVSVGSGNAFATDKALPALTPPAPADGLSNLKYISVKYSNRVTHNR